MQGGARQSNRNAVCIFHFPSITPPSALALARTSMSRQNEPRESTEGTWSEYAFNLDAPHLAEQVVVCRAEVAKDQVVVGRLDPDTWKLGSDGKTTKAWMQAICTRLTVHVGQ